MGPEDMATLTQELDALKETIQGAGGELEFIGSPIGLEEMGRGAYPDADPLSRFLFRRMFSRTMVMGAAIHEAGGARMGTAPDQSVLNRWNQSWDVPNLLVTDASSFAGSGVSGTTLTIMALTLRACRNLAQQLRAGKI
jgi:choline dehydrogenase-like flavoprotein